MKVCNSNKMECNICVTKYNLTKNRCVTCSYCEYQACKVCVQRYLLDCNNQDPHCMNCRRAWDRKQQIECTSKVFVMGDLKKYKEHVLFEREKALLPATQPHVEKYMLRKKIHELQYNSLIGGERYKKEVQEALSKYYSRLQEINKEIESMTSKNKKKNELIYLMPCNNNECKGYVEKNTTVCSLCHTKYCKECRMKQEDDHECKQEDIATAKLLMKDSKACPCCATLIFKIDGCNQMWCTQCHTAFDWITGVVERSRIHNPHYYELQRHVYGTADIPRVEDHYENCGDENVTIEMLYMKLRSLRMHDVINDVGSYQMSMYHTRYIVDHLPIRGVVDPMVNLKTRVRYLSNEISEEKFRHLLYRKYKSIEKKVQEREVLDMYINVINSGMQDIMNSTNSEDVMMVLSQLRNLRQYANECLRDIADVYNNQSITI